MRRHSPPRSFRHHNSPPNRRPPRIRGQSSLSPLSRSQPAPPGEERDKKSSPWDPPTKTMNLKRFRSRSREWMGAPFIDLSNSSSKSSNNMRHGTNRGDEEVSSRKSRERHRRERSPLSANNRHKDSLSASDFIINNRSITTTTTTATTKHSNSDINNYNNHHHNSDDFEENYLDRKPNNHLHHHSSDFRQKINNINKESENVVLHNQHHHLNVVDESSDSDRINRLEKLVEKLVEEGTKKNKGNLIIMTESSHHHHQDLRNKIQDFIPSNSKFTISMWLNQLHEECLKRELDDKSIMRFVQDQMTGIIKAWFKTVSNYDITWPELKMLITKTFPDNAEFAQTLKILIERDKTADENITQYFFSKLYLCEACKITGENAVSCLIDGLNNPFMKQDIKSHHFLTPEALYTEYFAKFPDNDAMMHVMENNKREIREIVPEYTNNDDGFIPLEVDDDNDDDDDVDVDEHCREISQERVERHHHHNHHQQIPVHYSTTSYNKYDKGNKKRCYTCKKFGHIAIECRHAPLCYSCKKEGHIAAKCPF